MMRRTVGAPRGFAESPHLNCPFKNEIGIGYSPAEARPVDPTSLRYRRFNEVRSTDGGSKDQTHRNQAERVRDECQPEHEYSTPREWTTVKEEREYIGDEQERHPVVQIANPARHQAGGVSEDRGAYRN